MGPVTVKLTMNRRATSERSLGAMEVSATADYGEDPQAVIEALRQVCCDRWDLEDAQEALADQGRSKAKLYGKVNWDKAWVDGATQGAKIWIGDSGKMMVDTGTGPRVVADGTEGQLISLDCAPSGVAGSERAFEALCADDNQNG